jgi:hypothetical protein
VTGSAGAETADLSVLPIVPPVAPAWANAGLDAATGISTASKNNIGVGYFDRLIGWAPQIDLAGRA